MKWYPRGCPVCQGDLYDDVMDPSELTCMMCARSFPAPTAKLTVLRPIMAQQTEDVLAEAA